MAATHGIGSPWRFRIEWAVIATLVVSAVLIGLAIAPFPHPFSEEFRSYLPGEYLPLDYGVPLNVPSGTEVSGSWTTDGAGPVSFQVYDSHAGFVYTANASSGSFDFVANTPPYFLAAFSSPVRTVHVSGAYWAPLL
jgi:hypothetical protein